MGMGLAIHIIRANANKAKLFWASGLIPSGVGISKIANKTIIESARLPMWVLSVCLFA